MKKRILVLVSTYNGEKYLSAQLDSVLRQKGVDVSILVRDDGSSDNTISILESYADKYKNVSFYQGDNVRPCRSFFDLLSHAQGFDYYAFCDQDDVWDEDKLISAINKIMNVPENTPALYCSNLKVVDERLNFCRLAHSASYNTKQRYSAFVDFYAVGCTQVFNQAAADLTKAHVRPDCIMHDSWIFMICNFLGEVVYDFDAHINYRQHSNNVVGTKKDGLSKLKERMKRVSDRSIQPRMKNAQLLNSEFHGVFPENDMEKINKILRYKDSFLAWVRLLFDFEIRSNHIGSDLRYRFLILLREI